MAGNAEAAWQSGGPAAWLPRSWEWARTVAAVQWVHASSLLLLLSFVAGAGMILIDGLAFGSALSRIPMLLHWWVPTVIGVAAAAAPVREAQLRRVALLIAVGCMLLITLDLLAAYLGAQLDSTLAFIRGEAVQRVIIRTTQPISWVATLWYWLTGDLRGASEVLVTYPAGHPRSQLMRAFAEASTVFVLIGTVGLLLALRRWIDLNVTFRNGSSDLVVGAVLGWMIAPSLSLIVGSLTSRQLPDVGFRGAPLGTVLIPSALMALLGLLGMVYAMRR